MNLRFRREANEHEDNDEYELENEDSDRPRTKRNKINYADEIRENVNELNYDLK